MARTLTLKLQGTSPISFSRYHSAPRRSDEPEKGPEAIKYDRRTWRLKLTTQPPPALDDDGLGKSLVNPDAKVLIPAAGFKSAIEGAAMMFTKKKSGMSTWTKNIVSGVIVAGDIAIDGVTASTVGSEELFLTADGKPSRMSKGGRVPRVFPVIPAGWTATVELLILDDTIPEDYLLSTLDKAGLFIGLGRWRPENRGSYGRFKVVDAKLDRTRE